MASDAETQIVAVERIKEYSDLPKELEVAIEASPPVIPPMGWPNAGAIVMQDLTVGYRTDTPLVLHGINVEIRAGEKIGICGRTGSGKSSLLSAIFRATDVQGGSLTIDGVNIRAVPVQLLRSRLTLIPQVCCVVSLLLVVFLYF